MNPIDRRSHLGVVARWLLFLVLGLTWLAASCGDDCCSTPKVPYPNRETPQGLLGAFARSLESQDIEKYEACLHDLYTFEFIPDDYDMAGVTLDKPYWGKAEDVASTTNMFASPQVAAIGFDLDNVDDFSGPDTLLAIKCWPKIDVTVAEGDEVPIVFQVRHSWLHFVLCPDPTAANLWVIRGIREEPIPRMARGLTATEAESFGLIKAMFR